MTGSALAAAVIGESPSADPLQLLAVVADRRLSVAALSALLLRDPRSRVIQEARGGIEVRDMLAAFRPAVVVVESGAIGPTPLIDPTPWDGRLLCLLDPEDEPGAFVQAVSAHAHGYLSRGASSAAFDEAIAKLRAKEPYFDPPFLGRILSAMRQAGNTPLARRATLSPRERDILVRIAHGQSTKEIARLYAITRKTVCNHIANIYRKLNLRHRGDLVLYAAQMGLTSLNSRPPAERPSPATG